MSEQEVGIILGSNKNPEENLRQAIVSLQKELEVIGISKVYKSSPIHHTDNPDYLNCAVLVTTSRSYHELKYQILRKIENQLHRVRSDNPNDPISIDLDIVLFGDKRIYDDNDELIIPDPKILSHAYILYPLAEIKPEFIHPCDELPLKYIKEEFEPDIDIREFRIS